MVFFFSSSMIIQQKGNPPMTYDIYEFQKELSIYVDVQMVNSVKQRYRNKYHFAHDKRTANTRKCVGITIFGW